MMEKFYFFGNGWSGVMNLYPYERRYPYELVWQANATEARPYKCGVKQFRNPQDLEQFCDELDAKYQDFPEFVGGGVSL